MRDLTPEQLEYAALDAAVTPKLMEKVMESVDARISMDHLLQEESSAANEEEQQQQRQQHQNGPIDTIPLHGPVIQRWDSDDALLKEIVSYRFLLLPESIDEATIGELQAKQIVGPSWIASAVWTAVENPPAPYVFPLSE